MHIGRQATFPGIDVMILKIFLQTKSAKKLAFLVQNAANFCKIWIITLSFKKNAIFPPKLEKIAENFLIITSTPSM
jgi:hypothetical protein